MISTLLFPCVDFDGAIFPAEIGKRFGGIVLDCSKGEGTDEQNRGELGMHATTDAFESKRHNKYKHAGTDEKVAFRGEVDDAIEV